MREKYLPIKANITDIFPPCGVLSHSFQWNQNKSCYSGSQLWKSSGIEEKLTSCCALFRSVFAYENIKDIFKIMKFSLGQEIPVPLSNLSSMKTADYMSIMPNNGNFSTLKEIGYVQCNDNCY